MELLGNTVSGVSEGDTTVYYSVRWPFGARVRVLSDNSVLADLSSGGHRLFEVGPVADTPENVALQVDAVSKSIFSQCAWYQT